MTPPVPADWPNRAASVQIRSAPHRWHVQRLGTGTPVLLLHGAGASGHSWAPLCDALVTPVQAIIPDLPGHGFTESPRGRARLPQVAADLAKLLETLEVTPKVVIGHSAGAAIGLEMIRSGLIAPRRMIALNAALEDFRGTAGIVFPAVARVLAVSPLTRFFLPKGAQADRQARSIIQTTGSTVSDAQIACYGKLISMRSHVNGTLGMMAQWSLSDLNAALGEIGIPVEFLHGANDRAVSPDIVRNAAATMPDTRVEVIDGLGHLAHEEAPEQIAKRIDALLS